MQKYFGRILSAGAVVLTALALSLILFGCQVLFGPPEEEKLDWYMDIELAAPASPNLITVNEYQVTHLILEVTDPEGQVIQVIRWAASEGPRRYQIPISMEGQHELTVLHVGRDDEQNPIEASESALFNIQAMVITEITVVPGAVGFINIDAPIQQAIDIARRDILPVVLEEAETSTYSLLRMDEMLPAGTRITPRSPTGGQTPPEEFVLDENGYLFYLDLDPGAFFGHPVKYFIVSENGDTEVLDAEWWPAVDNEVPKQFVSDTPLLKYVVQRTVIPRLPLTVIDWKLIPGIIQLLKTEAFICVQGLTPSESLYGCAVNTYTNGYNFFDAYKSSTSTLVGLTDYSADNILSEINSLAAAGYDVITIYIIAHGNTNFVNLGGVTMWASQFAATMTANPDVEFNFLLGSCHGGSFVDDLSALPNVRVVKTACQTTESAYADKDTIGGLTDYNPSDTGSEWFSSLLKAAERITTTASLWSVVTSQASTYGVSKTSVLLNEAGYLAVGLNRGLPTGLINYDLTDRAGWCTPDHYASWEVLP